MSTSRLVPALGALAALLLLAGCTYDYMQRTDRVSHRAGNAVEANMAIQTIDPSKDSQYNTKGLGKDGVALPGAEAEGEAAADE